MFNIIISSAYLRLAALAVIHAYSVSLMLKIENRVKYSQSNTSAILRFEKYASLIYFFRLVVVIILPF